MPELALYADLARYYDKIYWWKNYEKEVSFLRATFKKYGVKVDRILEVACGTGNHTKILTRLGYQVTGVDASREVLDIARAKVPEGPAFVQGDMRDLGKYVGGDFDAVVCLFSAISYNSTTADMRRTLKGFYGRLRPGGLVVFDTHFTRRGFTHGFRGQDIFDEDGVIGARLSKTQRKGNVGVINFTYLIKDGEKVILLRDDVHRLGLFDPKDLLSLMTEAGFSNARVFRDWTSFKVPHRGSLRENIFVGKKPAR